MTIDKQLKARARQLAEREGISYQAALYQLDPARGDAQGGPVDLGKLVALVMRAWAPGQTIPSGPVDPYGRNECSCGSDEDDEPMCICADYCSCPRCLHSEHRRAARCQLLAPTEGQPYARCGRLSQYKVVPFCAHRGGVYRAASEDDPEAENGSVHLGDSIQEHTAIWACSTQHARAVIAADRDARSKFEPGSALHTDQTYYRVDRARYQPDLFDVPSALHFAKDSLSSAEFWTGTAIERLYEGKDSNAEVALANALTGVAYALAYSVQHLTAPADDRVDDEPRMSDHEHDARMDMMMAGGMDPDAPDTW